MRKKKKNQKAGRVTQGVDPEFKLHYCKNREKERKKSKIRKGLESLNNTTDMGKVLTVPPQNSHFFKHT
jgi:hypothetical protein